MIVACNGMVFIEEYMHEVNLRTFGPDDTFSKHALIRLSIERRLVESIGVRPIRQNGFDRDWVCD